MFSVFFVALMLPLALASADFLPFKPDPETIPGDAESTHDITRIAGGHAAKVGEVPYQLSLRMTNSGHVCGATLILSPKTGKQLAVTAAHCVTIVDKTEPESPGKFMVVGGILGINETGQNLTIKMIKVHPAYHPLDEDGSPSDIAMLQLNGTFKLNSTVQPLALPVLGQKTTGKVSVSGWGITNSNSTKYSSVLRAAQLPLINITTCNEWIKQKANISNDPVYSSNLCAGLEKGGDNTCRGDGGGPMVASVNGKKYLAGVMSWGLLACDEPKSPSVFVKVANYISWITNVSAQF